MLEEFVRTLLPYVRLRAHVTFYLSTDFTLEDIARAMLAETYEEAEEALGARTYADRSAARKLADFGKFLLDSLSAVAAALRLSGTDAQINLSRVEIRGKETFRIVLRVTGEQSGEVALVFRVRARERNKPPKWEVKVVLREVEAREIEEFT